MCAAHERYIHMRSSSTFWNVKPLTVVVVAGTSLGARLHVLPYSKPRVLFLGAHPQLMRCAELRGRHHRQRVASIRGIRMILHPFAQPVGDRHYRGLMLCKGASACCAAFETGWQLPRWLTASHPGITACAAGSMSDRLSVGCV